MATKAPNEIMLEGPESYHAWFSLITGSFPEDLWRYVDPDTEDIYEVPVAVTFDSIKLGATTLRDLTAPEKTLYASLKSVHKSDVSQYQRYLSEVAKLRSRILSTIAEDKRAMLRADKTVRIWITNLQTSTKPTDAQMTDLIWARHRILLGSKYIEWPSIGPEKWLTEWQKLMVDCEIWCPALHNNWARDFNLVWGEVPGAKRLCDRLVEALGEGELADWDIFKATRELRQAWEQKSIRNGMKVAGKGKITRAAFAAQPRFDGSTSEDQPEPTPSDTTTLTVNQNRSRSTSRKRSGTDSTQREGRQRGQKRNTLTCWGCAGPHIDFKCPLITEYNPQGTPVPTEWQERFDRKMLDRTFEHKVTAIREASRFRRELARSAENEAGLGRE
jgi:hypothetical protein